MNPFAPLQAPRKLPSVLDYGCDPLGNGQFRMVPSGDIVDAAERARRLDRNHKEWTNDCLGLSWDEIERKQGGKLTRPKSTNDWHEKLRVRVEAEKSR